MTPQEFAFLRTYVKQRSGIDLGDDKGYLVECRLIPVAREAGLGTLGELVATLSAAHEGELSRKVVEAMTTNESSFFRDRVPFENFREAMIPHFLEQRVRQRTMRIWCAAASTGQEPYSLAMAVLEESQRLAGWRTDILATDLSSAVVSRGQRGTFSQFEVQRGVPIQLLMKYFDQRDDRWEVREAVRRLVRWRVFNLLETYASLGRFDIIFCRNVLIYFDRQTKADVLARMAAALEPDGFLVLGAAETVVGLTDRFEPVEGRRGMYRPLRDGATSRHAFPVLRTA